MNKVNIIREKSDKKKRTYLPVKYIIEFLLLEFMYTCICIYIYIYIFV